LTGVLLVLRDQAIWGQIWTISDFGFGSSNEPWICSRLGYQLSDPRLHVIFPASLNEALLFPGIF